MWSVRCGVGGGSEVEGGDEKRATPKEADIRTAVARGRQAELLAAAARDDVSAVERALAAAGPDCRTPVGYSSL